MIRVISFVTVIHIIGILSFGLFSIAKPKPMKKSNFSVSVKLEEHKSSIESKIITQIQPKKEYAPVKDHVIEKKNERILPQIEKVKTVQKPVIKLVQPSQKVISKPVIKTEPKPINNTIKTKPILNQVKPKVKKANPTVIKKENKTVVNNQPIKKEIPSDNKRQQEQAIATQKLINLTSTCLNKLNAIDNKIKTAQVKINNHAQNDHFEAYCLQLTNFLQQTLRFPTVGHLKIELVISNSGKILSYKIISFESEINKLYLENKLANIDFPVFDNKAILQETFVILLTDC